MFRAFHQVPTILHGMMACAGKTTNTSNTRRVGFAISIKAKIHLTGPIDCWPRDRPALQPQLQQYSQSRVSLRFQKTTIHYARGVLHSERSLARENSKKLQGPPRQHTEPMIMDTGLQGDTIGSRVIVGERLNRYVRWIRECSGGVPERGRGRSRCVTSMLSLMLHLNVDEITATKFMR